MLTPPLSSMTPKYYFRSGAGFQEPETPHSLLTGRTSAVGDLQRTGLASVPIPSMVASTRSPFLSHRGGVMNIPTPEGVPVEMTSPASRGKAELMYSIRKGTSKIRSLVFDF